MMGDNEQGMTAVTEWTQTRSRSFIDDNTLELDDKYIRSAIIHINGSPNNNNGGSPRRCLG
jgi:hypothetical protein